LSVEVGSRKKLPDLSDPLCILQAIRYLRFLKDLAA
jgi:hypothetical protein